MSVLYFYRKFAKLLSVGKCSHGGRNFLGRICVFGRGGGQKRKYRMIDFYRRLNEFCEVKKIVYDCNRSAYLALVLYDNGFISYIIAAEGLRVDDIVYSGAGLGKLTEAFIHKATGWALPLRHIRLFTLVNNLELVAFHGSKILRSAGCSGLFIGISADKAIIKLASGWSLSVGLNCMAVVGRVSNVDYKYYQIGSAGKARGLGFRPKVRGVAKNPCDHPHGGGNGKKSKKPCPVNRFGFPSVGRATKNRQIDVKRRRLLKIFKYEE